LDINVATDGYGAFTVSNTKTWVAGSLSWSKQDDLGNPLGGATFQVCRTHDRFGTDIPDQCVTVLDNSIPDANSSPGEFLLTGLILGRYTITESIAPPGYSLDSHVETVELTLAIPTVAVTYIWINTPTNLGCTPGFWQGGAGAPLWDGIGDAAWVPFTHTTIFNSFFNSPPEPRLNGLTMMDLVGSGGTSDWAIKAGRDMVAAYLNESAFPQGFPATSIAALEAMWYAAVALGDPGFEAFHTTVSAWNSPQAPGYCPLP
jgi:hypothetical protein